MDASKLRPNDRIEERSPQTDRKRELEDIVVARPWEFEKFDSKWIEACQGLPHFWRDDLVLLSMKDPNLRNVLPREYCFQRSDIVEAVAKEATQRDVDLCPDHIVHGGESRNDQNLANKVFSCELEGGSPSERMSEEAERISAHLPAFGLDESLEGALRSLEDCLRIRASFANPIARIIDQQIAAARIRKSTKQGQPGQGHVAIPSKNQPEILRGCLRIALSPEERHLVSLTCLEFHLSDTSRSCFLQLIRGIAERKIDESMLKQNQE